MDVTTIEQLAKLMKETGLSSLELSEEGSTLKLERKQEAATLSVAPASLPVPVSPFTPAPAENPEPSPAREEGSLVLSPTVGVFYAAPAPDAPPYVEIGSKIKKGDVLCVIEAMKLMNEIPAETNGTVAEILAGNGQVVEFGQPLFRIV